MNLQQDHNSIIDKIFQNTQQYQNLVDSARSVSLQRTRTYDEKQPFTNRKIIFSNHAIQNKYLKSSNTNGENAEEDNNNSQFFQNNQAPKNSENNEIMEPKFLSQKKRFKPEIKKQISSIYDKSSQCFYSQHNIPTSVDNLDRSTQYSASYRNKTPHLNHNKSITNSEQQWQKENQQEQLFQQQQAQQSNHQQKQSQTNFHYDPQQQMIIQDNRGSGQFLIQNMQQNYLKSKNMAFQPKNNRKYTYKNIPLENVKNNIKSNDKLLKNLRIVENYKQRTITQQTEFEDKSPLIYINNEQQSAIKNQNFNKEQQHFIPREYCVIQNPNSYSYDKQGKTMSNFSNYNFDNSTDNDRTYNNDSECLNSTTYKKPQLFDSAIIQNDPKIQQCQQFKQQMNKTKNNVLYKFVHKLRKNTHINHSNINNQNKSKNNSKKFDPVSSLQQKRAQSLKKVNENQQNENNNNKYICLEDQNLLNLQNLRDFLKNKHDRKSQIQQQQSVQKLQQQMHSHSQSIFKVKRDINLDKIAKNKSFHTKLNKSFFGNFNVFQQKEEESMKVKKYNLNSSQQEKQQQKQYKKKVQDLKSLKNIQKSFLKSSIIE